MTDEHSLPSADGHNQPATPRSEAVLDIQVDYDLCVNYAMQQNDVPVVKLLTIGNVGTEPLEDQSLVSCVNA